MRITNIIAVVLMAVATAAMFSFLFYPYSELGTMQDKLNHAVNCLYVLCASLLALLTTACIAARN